MKDKIWIFLDVWGWYNIMYGSSTLQCFRTEKECRQWLADTYRIRKVMGVF